MVVLLFLPTLGGMAQEAKLTPGKERWAVKSSVTSFGVKDTLLLEELLALPDPLSTYKGKERTRLQEDRISAPVGPRSLREGDIVTTEGYLLLIALEKDDKGSDGDFHIQIRTKGVWGDTCLVVESTWPPFIHDNDRLLDSCRKVRTFFDERYLQGRKIACFGTQRHPAPHLRITGQLFFDAHHMNTGPRGKQNPKTKQKMKSYTCWEIHPIISVQEIE